MRTLLRRHFMPIQAYFDFSLVLTYAFPDEMLLPLLAPGLRLDTYEGFGFLAIAMVQTRELRPVFLPRVMGQQFFLTGYRIFARYQSASGRWLRGLQILRSDTDHTSMVLLGNVLTHYGYHKAAVNIARTDQALAIGVKTAQAEADIRVVADLACRPTLPPVGSPFPSIQVARKFAGPLPFTFSYERETHSMLRVEGVRKNWKPAAIHVDVEQATFLKRAPFNNMPEPQLANAFFLEHVPYRWKRGVREELIVSANALQKRGD